MYILIGGIMKRYWFKRWAAMTLCAAVCVAAFAGEEAEEKRTEGEKVTYFQFSLFPGLGVNGWRTWQYTNYASINLLGDVSKNERAFTLSGIWSAVRGDAQGLQVAGMVNYAGSGRGMMVSGVTNVVKGGYDGLMVSGLANVENGGYDGLMVSGLTNVVNGGYDGLAIGGLANVAGDVRGGQVTAGMNFSKDLMGLQLGGIANVARREAMGMELSKTVDYASGSVWGAQVAGLTSMSVGRVAGAQLSGAVNFAVDVDGMQLAGFTNVAKGDVDGAQVSAVVNVAEKVRGVQIGLVNVAEESDVPIGLINVIEEGEMSIGAGYDMMGNVMLMFRSGGKYTYGIVGAGYNHYFRYAPVALEAGLGVHAPVCKWFRVDNEFRYSAPLLVAGPNMGEVQTSRYMNVSYSLLPFFRVSEHFGVYAGMTLNYMLSDSRLELPGLVDGGTVWQRERQDGVFGQTRESLFFGFAAGIQVLF